MEWWEPELFFAILVVMILSDNADGEHWWKSVMWWRIWRD